MDKAEKIEKNEGDGEDTKTMARCHEAASPNGEWLLKGVGCWGLGCQSTRTAAMDHCSESLVMEVGTQCIHTARSCHMSAGVDKECGCLPGAIGRPAAEWHPPKWHGSPFGDRDWKALLQGSLSHNSIGWRQCGIHSNGLGCEPLVCHQKMWLRTKKLHTYCHSRFWAPILQSNVLGPLSMPSRTWLSLTWRQLAPHSTCGRRGSMPSKNGQPRCESQRAAHHKVVMARGECSMSWDWHTICELWKKL